MKTLLARATLVLATLLVLASQALAQTPAATPLEMRHFWHVFIAYAIAWMFVGGWLFLIVRRLRRVEERLR